MKDIRTNYEYTETECDACPNKVKIALYRLKGIRTRGQMVLCFDCRQMRKRLYGEKLLTKIDKKVK